MCVGGGGGGVVFFQVLNLIVCFVCLLLVLWLACINKNIKIKIRRVGGSGVGDMGLFFLLHVFKFFGVCLFFGATARMLNYCYVVCLFDLYFLML